MPQGVFPTTRRCVFCGGERLTREHVWPQWIVAAIRQHVGPGPIRVARPGDTPYDVPELDVAVRMVCATCNNGWMSSLETGVRPALEPMILGRLPVLLTPAMQALLARWAFKTALMVDLFKPQSERDYSAREYRMMLDPNLFSVTARSSDPLVTVWAAAYSGKGATYSSRSSAFPFTAPPSYTRDGIVATTGHSTRGVIHTLRVMHSLFQVLVIERGANPLTSVSGPPASIQLAPPTRSPAEWPLRGEAFGDADIDRFVNRPVELSLLTDVA